MTVSSQFIRLAEQIERDCESLYALAAVIFADDTVFAQLLLQLSKEEAQHAARIGLLGRLSAQNLDLSGDPRLPLDALRRLQGEIQILREMLENPQTPLSADEARQSMIQMEQHLSVIHAEAVVSFSDKQVRSFFQALVTADRAHRELLSST